MANANRVCKFCGATTLCGYPTRKDYPLPYTQPIGGTEMCDMCWETERRLEEFLKSPKARKYVKELLKTCTSLKQ